MTTPPLPPFEEKIYVNINGKVFNSENAKISVLDRGFLYGDSIYEVTRTYSGVPFLLQEHLDRLWHSASKLHMHLDFSQEQIIHQVNSVLAELESENAYIRIIITRGEGAITLDPTKPEKNNLVIIVKEQPENPSWWYDKGVNVVIADIQRIHKGAVDPNVKSGNYLNNVMAIMQAKNEGAFDAIMLNQEGFVTEGSTNNIWMVKDGEIFTPPLSAGILEGITRKSLLHLARKNEIHVYQKNISPEDVINADEVFLTATTKEIIPITQVDNSPVGIGTPGPIFKKLRKIYTSFIKDQTQMS